MEAKRASLKREWKGERARAENIGQDARIKDLVVGIEKAATLLSDLSRTLSALVYDMSLRPPPAARTKDSSPPLIQERARRQSPPEVTSLPGSSSDTSIALQSPISMTSKARLPFPGQPGAPMFDGADVTRFIEEWNDICEDCGIEEAEKTRRVPKYMTRAIGEYIRIQEEYENKNWEGLRKFLLQEYKQKDTVQQVKSRAYLEALSAKPREMKDVKHYCQQYTAISKDLLSKGLVDKEIRCRLFIQGLPKDLVAVLFRTPGLDLSEEAFFTDFDKLRTHAIRAAITEQRLNEFTSGDRSKREEASELVDRVDGTVKQTKKSKAERSGESDGMDFISERLKDLTLSVTQIAKESVSAALKQLPAVAENVPAASAVQPGPWRETRRYTQPRDGSGLICYFCNETGHVRPRCPLLKEYADKGYLHINERNMICAGRYSPSAPLIRFYPGEPQYKQVLARQNFSSASSEQKMGEISSFQVIGEDREDEGDLSDLELEMDIQSLPNSASVSAAKIMKGRQEKAGFTEWTEPQKRILKKTGKGEEQASHS